LYPGCPRIIQRGVANSGFGVDVAVGLGVSVARGMDVFVSVGEFVAVGGTAGSNPQAGKRMVVKTAIAVQILAVICVILMIGSPDTSAPIWVRSISKNRVPSR